MAEEMNAAGNEEASFTGLHPSSASSSRLPLLSPAQRAALPQYPGLELHPTIHDNAPEAPSFSQASVRQRSQDSYSPHPSVDRGEDPVPQQARGRQIKRGRRESSLDFEFEFEPEDEARRVRQRGRYRYSPSRSASPAPERRQGSDRNFRGPFMDNEPAYPRGPTLPAFSNRARNSRAQQAGSQNRGLPQSHPGSAPHRTWSPIHTHTAKCDRCLIRNCDILQRCNCNKQFCRTCLDAVIGQDGQHLAPIGGFDWAPKAPGPPRTRRPRARKPAVPSLANGSGSGRGSVSQSTNQPEFTPPASRVLRVVPRTTSRSVNSSFMTTSQPREEEIEENIEVTGRNSLGFRGDRAPWTSDPLDHQGSDTDFEPMTIENARRSAYNGPTRGTRDIEDSFHAQRTVLPHGRPSGNAATIGSSGQNLQASYSQGASLTAGSSQDGGSGQDQAGRGLTAPALVVPGYEVPDFRSIQTFGDGVALLKRLRESNHGAREADFQYLRNESWASDPILQRIREDEGDEEANTIFQGVTLMMRILLGFFGAT